MPMKVDFALAVAGSTTGQTHIRMNSKLTCAGSFMVCMANNLKRCQISEVLLCAPG